MIFLCRRCGVTPPLTLVMLSSPADPYAPGNSALLEAHNDGYWE
jgi:hypothetical protein